MCLCAQRSPGSWWLQSGRQVADELREVKGWQATCTRFCADSCSQWNERCWDLTHFNRHDNCSIHRRLLRAPGGTFISVNCTNTCRTNYNRLDSSPQLWTLMGDQVLFLVAFDSYCCSCWRAQLWRKFHPTFSGTTTFLRFWMLRWMSMSLCWEPRGAELL